MSRFVAARQRDLDLAKSIDACFKPAPVLGSAKPSRKASKSKRGERIDVILEAPGAATSTLALWADDSALLILTKLPRQPRYRFSCDAKDGKQLSLRLELGSRTYNLSLPATLSGHRELRIVQWAADAPPRVMLDGVQINRGAGVHLVQTGELPELPNRRYELILRQSKLDMLDEAEPVRVYIDDELVEEPTGGSLEGARVHHTEKLGLGLHRVVVVSKRRGWVIADTDIVVNGLGSPRVSWSEPNLSSAKVSVNFGAHEFLGPRAPGNIEACSTIMFDIGGILIGGVEIPDGIGNFEDEVRRAKEFAEAMAANYRRYWELRLSAKAKRERGQPLTNDELWAEENADYGEMQRWIKGEKKREGHDPVEGGYTDLDGTIILAGPDPQDAFDELERRVTLHIHEPSHVAGLKRAAAEFGLDWDKLVAFIRAGRKKRALAEAGKTEAEIDALLTDEEKAALAWADNAETFLAYFRYLLRFKSGLDIAPEELQEYEAEVQFFTELLAKIRQDREEHTLVPDRELWMAVQYLFGIRDTLRNLPEAEKERLRSRLRQLRRSVQASDKLSNEQKAHMMMMIDETEAALG